MIMCSCRCKNATQVLEYEQYIRKLDYANDNGIFDLTGCLSRCHKYKYKARSLGIVMKNSKQTGQDISPNTIQLSFYFPTTEHEVREQVWDQFNLEMVLKSKLINYLLVLHLWLGIDGSWCWRFPGLAHRPKHLWNIWHFDHLAHAKEMTEKKQNACTKRLSWSAYRSRKWENE